MSNSLISVRGVSKKFCRDSKRSLIYGMQDIAAEFFGGETDQLRPGEFWALKDVSFEVAHGDAVGLIGVNGCGKTTLLKIIANILKPQVGSVTVNGTLAPLIALGAGFNPSLSGKENIFLNLSLLGLKRSEIRDRFDAIVDFAELEEVLSAPVRTYSSGMKARLGFSCAIHLNPNILLVDEALAVGDARFRVKCYQRLAKLREDGTAFILVSHSSAAITSICNRAIYLKKGKISYNGTSAQAVQLYKKDQGGQKERVLQIPDPRADSNRRIHIEAVEYVSADQTVVRSGEPFLIKINLSSQVDIESLGVSLIIRPAGTSGMDTLLLNSNLESRSFSVGKGRSSVQVRFPFLGLAGGEYSVKAQIFNSRNPLEVFDIKPDIELSVVGLNEMASSSYYQPHDWSLSSQEGQHVGQENSV